MFVVEEYDGQTNVRRQEVELGPISGTSVRINFGIDSGTQIVTKGVDLLTDGQEVVTIDPSVERFGI